MGKWESRLGGRVPDPIYPNVVYVDGVPVIVDKHVPVSVIVALVQRGQTLEEIVRDYAGRLTLTDVYVALGYYCAHPEEINGYLAAHQAALEEAAQLAKA